MIPEILFLAADEVPAISNLQHLIKFEDGSFIEFNRDTQMLTIVAKTMTKMGCYVMWMQTPDNSTHTTVYQRKGKPMSYCGVWSMHQEQTTMEDRQ